MEEKIACPKCGFEQARVTECQKCGIVFAKFNPLRNTPVPPGIATEKLSEPSELPDNIDSWMYPVRKKTSSDFSNGVYRTGKYFIIGLMVFFFFYMVIKRSSWCFLDYVNLPFHESGHLIFGFFGETISFLGGTMGQLMWPLILMIYFFMRRELLSSSFCLFWFGENFLNISKYIADARSMVLPLVGGAYMTGISCLESGGC